MTSENNAGGVPTIVMSAPASLYMQEASLAFVDPSIGEAKRAMPMSYIIRCSNKRGASLWEIHDESVAFSFVFLN